MPSDRLRIMLFRDAARLRTMLAPTTDPSPEPIVNFPLGWYEEFLKQIIQHDIQIIRY